MTHACAGLLTRWRDARGRPLYKTISGDPCSRGHIADHYLEACMRAMIDGAEEPLFLSSGAEDYFLSAYYFDEGEFKTPNSGLTYFDGKGTLSAYKVHDRDPVSESSDPSPEARGCAQHGTRLHGVALCPQSTGVQHPELMWHNPSSTFGPGPGFCCGRARPPPAPCPPPPPSHPLPLFKIATSHVSLVTKASGGASGACFSCHFLFGSSVRRPAR